jgi:hypothetical protein
MTTSKKYCHLGAKVQPNIKNAMAIDSKLMHRKTTVQLLSGSTLRRKMTQIVIKYL